MPANNHVDDDFDAGGGVGEVEYFLNAGLALTLAREPFARTTRRAGTRRAVNDILYAVDVDKEEEEGKALAGK